MKESMYFIATTKKKLYKEKMIRVKKQNGTQQVFKFNWYLQNTLSKKGRKYIFFKCTWTFTKADHILDH